MKTEKILIVGSKNGVDTTISVPISDFVAFPSGSLGIDSASSEEVLEIVEDQDQEQPPWDGDGTAYVAQTFADYIISTSHQSARSILQVPCGLLEFRQENFHTGAENCHVKFEVLAIEDM